MFARSDGTCRVNRPLPDALSVPVNDITFSDRQDGLAGAPTDCDVVVVGAGIVGLACASELARRHTRIRIVVLDKEQTVGAHQTSHNSGVIHAGIYYRPGSLKARLCVDGARKMYAYCEEHGLPVERCGKLIVARDRAELPALRDLAERGRRNGVEGLRWVDGNQIAEVEPHAVGVAAIHSANTGIVDYRQVAESLAGELRARGHRLILGSAVLDATSTSTAVNIRHEGGRLLAGRALFCAGGWSDRLARRTGADPDPRIVPFRGAYLHLRPERRHLVRGMIYPVPDPELPFLGVHLTRHLDGSVSVGPTALMVAARDAYRLHDVHLRDVADTLRWPGAWRVAWRHRRTAVDELRRAVGARTVMREAAEYVPGLEAGDAVAGPAGVRAQAITRSGELVDDFVFSETERILHVRNAPSPAATSALAVAEMVADRFDARSR